MLIPTPMTALLGETPPANVLAPRLTNLTSCLWYRGAGGFSIPRSFQRLELVKLLKGAHKGCGGSGRA